LLISDRYVLNIDLNLSDAQRLDKRYSGLVLTLKEDEIPSCLNEPVILTLTGHEQSGVYHCLVIVA
jgi:hypothetical protein